MVDMWGDNYEERLKRLSLTTLETRRLRGDLFEGFKIMKNVDDVESSNIFILSWFNFKSHSPNSFKPRYNLMPVNTTLLTMVDVWNRLRQSIINSDTTNFYAGPG